MNRETLSVALVKCSMCNVIKDRPVAAAEGIICIFRFLQCSRAVARVLAKTIATESWGVVWRTEKRCRGWLADRLDRALEEDLATDMVDLGEEFELADFLTKYWFGVGCRWEIVYCFALLTAEEW